MAHLVCVVGLCLAFGLLAWGCDSGEDFTYANETGAVLYVQVNNGSRNAVRPNEHRTISHLTSQIGSGNDPLRFVVTDEDGCILFTKETTLDTFRERDNLTFTIHSADLIGMDNALNCTTAE